MICWYCHWGWPKLVAEIYKKALKKLEGKESPLLFGPAHIVWEYENFDNVDWCLENFEEYKGDYSDKELEIVRQSLKELNELPFYIRDPKPEDYDDEHPDQFPPPNGIEMVKIYNFIKNKEET